MNQSPAMETANQYPLFSAEKRAIAAFTEKEPDDPCEWIEKNLILPENSAYAQPGPVRLFNFQKWLIRKALNKIKSPVLVHRFIICSSVQVGKSFISELIMCYLIRWRSAKIMLAYSTNNMVRRTIKERIIPLINANSELNQYKTGVEDDFSMEYLTLTKGTIRVASAEAESTIASFSLPYIIASELAKYPTTKIDIGQLLEGRKNFFEESGNWLIVMESSPKFDDDAFGKIVSSAQVQLYPHVKLSCGHWCFMEDRKTEGLKDENGDTIQSPELIKSNVNNAWLVCPQCQHKTFEAEHAALLRGDVIWARSPADIISDMQPGYDYENICVNMNKYLNSGYHFNDCLSEFFKHKNVLDGGISLRTWYNESMGRPQKRIDDQSIKDSQTSYTPKKLPYTIYSSDPKENKIPLPGKFLLFGGDTQDRSIFFTVRAFTGKNTDTYLVDAGEVQFDFLNETKEEICQRFQDRTYNKEYFREDGERLYILGGMLDVGGHRQELASFICAKTPNLSRYKGSSKGELAPFIEKGPSGIWFGNITSLSLQINYLMYNTNFYVPSDISTFSDYLTQLTGETFIQIENKYGATTQKRIVKQNNHCRSAENYMQLIAYHLQAFNPGSEKIARRLGEKTGIKTSVSSSAEMAAQLSKLMGG